MVPTADRTTIERLATALTGMLGGEVVSIDEGVRAAASRDYAWMSPILTEDLPDTIADVVVRPRAAAELPAILDLVHRHRVPLTVRGRGTGNYGQAVPLAGGVVVDMGACAAILGITDGIAHVEAGVTFAQLEQQAAAHGLEAPVMPSMLSSTVGGFLSGGNQGIGSIENGSIWDGWVRALEIVPCAPRAEPFTVAGSDVMPFLHSYGTAGVVAAAQVRLVPKRQRTVVFAAFDGLGAAARCGLDLMTRLDTPPRALSIADRELVPTLPAHAANDPERVMLRVAVATRTVSATARLISDHGGEVRATDDGALPALYGSIYNHATLRAQRVDPRVCALQVRGPAIIDHEAAVRRVLPDVRLHLDGNAPRQHGPGYSGLLLATWSGRERLDEAIEALRALGIIVISPHTYVLGGHGNVERIREVAPRVDPDGLLNPGKLPALVA